MLLTIEINYWYSHKKKKKIERCYSTFRFYAECTNERENVYLFPSSSIIIISIIKSIIFNIPYITVIRFVHLKFPLFNLINYESVVWVSNFYQYFLVSYKYFLFVRGLYETVYTITTINNNNNDHCL